MHKAYPSNKPALAAKSGKPVVWKRPEQTPGLTDRQDAIAELGKTLDAIGATYFTFQSRDRTDLGGLVSIQFFNNTIKILLPHEFASALNLFVSTYVRDL